MVKLNKIYTRTGDDGTTGLVDGSRRAKADPRMHAIGEVDELNSAVGLATLAVPPETAADLRRIQNDLFDLGADLCRPERPKPKTPPLRVTQAQTDRLEREIDAMNGKLAPLNSFVLPGGTPAAASLHLARTLIRRSEEHTSELQSH